MSSKFGENSKASANSKAYNESVYWKKREERLKAEKEAEQLKDDTGMTWLRDNNTHLNKPMPLLETTQDDRIKELESLLLRIKKLVRRGYVVLGEPIHQELERLTESE